MTRFLNNVLAGVAFGVTAGIFLPIGITLGGHVIGLFL
jgi:hypothetical protein